MSMTTWNQAVEKITLALDSLIADRVAEEAEGLRAVGLNDEDIEALIEIRRRELAAWRDATTASAIAQLAGDTLAEGSETLQ